jgi:selenoprotein W-related protein
MAARPVKVAVSYCAECGYEPQTIALAQSLMITFGRNLSSIELIPWEEGSFEVTVGGELVHSMYRDGGFPEHQTIADAVRRKLAQGAAASAG